MFSKFVVALGIGAAVNALPAPGSTRTHTVTVTVTQYTTVDPNAVPTANVWLADVQDAKESFDNGQYTPWSPTPSPPGPTAVTEGTVVPPPNIQLNQVVHDNPPVVNNAVVNNPDPVKATTTTAPIVPPLAQLPAPSGQPALYSNDAWTPVPGRGQDGATNGLKGHEQYGSSKGVLGCKIDPNRVAYIPLTPDCNNPCVEFHARGRTVTLLHVDKSKGSWDISYDAWNYLMVGQPATVAPQQGNGKDLVDAEYRIMPMQTCVDAGLLQQTGGKLPITAPNPDFMTWCPAGSWVRENSILYNIANAQCTLGHDEVCTYNEAVSNQAQCAHTTIHDPLVGLAVKDISYTG